MERLGMAVSRRKFIGTALGAGATGLIATPGASLAARAAYNLLTIENESWRVGIDRATGCITSLESREQGWMLRGAGLRLHVPAPEHRFHYLSEHHAESPHIEVEGNHAAIAWEGFNSERMGKLDIEVKQSIRLEGAAIHFGYEIRNGSDAVI